MTVFIEAIRDAAVFAGMLLLPAGIYAVGCFVRGVRAEYNERRCRR